MLPCQRPDTKGLSALKAVLSHILGCTLPLVGNPCSAFVLVNEEITGDIRKETGSALGVCRPPLILPNVVGNCLTASCPLQADCLQAYGSPTGENREGKKVLSGRPPELWIVLDVQ